MKNDATPTPDAAINNNSNTALMLTREEVEARLRALGVIEPALSSMLRDPRGELKARGGIVPGDDPVSAALHAYQRHLDAQTPAERVTEAELAEIDGKLYLLQGATAQTARSVIDRLAAEVRALRIDLEDRCAHLDMSNAEIERLGAVLQAERAAWCKASGAESPSHLTALLAARPAPAAEALHGDDPCAACSAILGSPQSCTVTHDVGPGAYPVDASLEARAKGAWIASEVRNPNASRWDDLEEAERCGWLAVVRAVDASRPALTVEEARAIAPTEAENRAWKAGVAYGRSSRPALTEDAQRLKLAADLRDIAAWHEGQANKDSATWAWHTNAASTCYAAAFSVEHGAAPKRPALTEEEAERAAVALADTLSDIPEGMFGTSVPIIKATLLRVSRGDIPADVRAGETATATDPVCRCGHKVAFHRGDGGCPTVIRGDGLTCPCELSSVRAGEMQPDKPREPPCVCGHDAEVHGREGCQAVVSGEVCRCERYWMYGGGRQVIRGPLSRILHGLSEMIDPHTEAGHLTDAELAEKVNTRVWTPIKPDGAIDEAELRRPVETPEPTKWEVAIPAFGARQSAVVIEILWAARLCPRHRFWVLTAQLKTLPEEWPENVTLAVGPLHTQAEADAAIPALLAVKAARREVVFAPTEAIEIHVEHLAPFKEYDASLNPTPKVDAIRVRGGAPEYVASLREQCQRRRRRARRRCPTTRARRAAVDCPSPARHRREGDDDMSSDEQREGARAWTKERAEAARRRCADAPLELVTKRPVRRLAIDVPTAALARKGSKKKEAAT